MFYKISVIIPIYCVEQYIERCARSLFEQTLDAIEFIFVDDCTIDNSLSVLDNVLDDYPNRKEHVKILRHEINKGLPQARKTGVSVAKGEYIAHCDSDDWVCENMYDCLYSFAKAGKYDIAYCDYYLSNGHTDVPKKTLTNKRLIQGPVWNKIVRRTLYSNDIIFPTANKAEDGALMTQLSFYATSIGYLNKPLYHYFINPSSMTRILSVENCLNKLKQEKENTSLRISFIEKKGKALNYKTDIVEWKLMTRNNLLPLIGENKYYKMWLNTYSEINIEFFFTKGISLRAKFVFLLQLCRLYDKIKK